MKQLLFVHGWNLLENDDELIKAIESREINPFEEKKKTENDDGEIFTRISGYKTRNAK